MTSSYPKRKLSLLLFAIFATTYVSLFATPAIAGDITDFANDKWLMFTFEAAGTPAKGCGPADPAALFCFVPTTVNGERADAPPWTFSAGEGGATITLQDIGVTGDMFEVFDHGTSIGSTSDVIPGIFCGFTPDECAGIGGSSGSSGDSLLVC